MNDYKKSPLVKFLFVYMFPSMIYYAMRTLITELTFPLLQNFVSPQDNNSFLIINLWFVVRTLISIIAGLYVIRSHAKNKGWIGKIYNQKRAFVVFSLFVIAFETVFVLQLLEAIA